MSQADGILFEIEDNFQNKRTATLISIVLTELLLNIPVKHSKANHQRTKDIQVDSDVDWQKQQSLETAYRGL
jgi:hypothetical protein